MGGEGLKWDGKEEDLWEARSHDGVQFTIINNMSLGSSGAFTLIDYADQPMNEIHSHCQTLIASVSV